jgi:hypothetical protein
MIVNERNITFLDTAQRGATIIAYYLLRIYEVKLPRLP